MKRHPGITMHKLSFGGGLEGLTFVIGTVLIFVFGLPALWYFAAFALVLGIGVAVFLKGASNRISLRNKPLSLLAPPEPILQPSRRRKSRIRWHRLSRFATA
jgi:hypothetical protein